MRSMTGYGSGSGRSGSASAHVEMRTVNHRYLDVRVTVSAGPLRAAAAVERRIRERLLRGRVEATLAIESQGEGAGREEAVVAAYRSLDRIRIDLGVTDPIDLGAVFAAVSGAAEPPEVSGPDAETAALEAADRAIDQVQEMREREGATLRESVVACVAGIDRYVGTLAGIAAALRESLPDRVRTRVEAALGAVGAGILDADRLAAEVALALDRADIAEEVDRLRSHVVQLRTLLDAGGDVGRRVNFLAQEILREANTVASKAPDAAAVHTVMEIRALAERMREQIQNVE